MKATSPLLALALLIGSHEARCQQPWWEGQPNAADGSGQQFCDSAGPAQFPRADQPTAAEAQALGRDCDAIALYEGLGQPPDYRKARLCAFVERANGDADGAEPLSGDGVLLMIYANGRGVPANLPLAKQIACQIWAAPAEMDLRQQHLDAIASGAASADLHLCDDITSGMMMGLCAWEGSRATDLARARRLDALSTGWSVEAKQAFERLRQAEAAFSESSSGNEEDMSGTARGALAVGRGDMLDAEFEKTVQDYLAGAFAADAGDPQADAKLNTTYRRMLAAFSDPDVSLMTITPEGLRDTQRLWLRYRDAWLAFGRILKPEIDSAWLARALTAQRTTQLEDIIEYAE